MVHAPVGGWKVDDVATVGDTGIITSRQQSRIGGTRTRTKPGLEDILIIKINKTG